MCPPATSSAPAATRAPSAVERCASGRFLAARQGEPARWWWQATTRRAAGGAVLSSDATRCNRAGESRPDWWRQGRTELRPTTTSVSVR
jgi:hypothetical protein